MTRRLILIRHAHAPHPRGLDDHERPLSERGRQQAFSVAEQLVEREWLPEHTLSSDAERAKQTWHTMKPVLEAACGRIHTDYTEQLYAPSTEDIREAIWAIDADTETLAVVGHNPGFSDMAGWVSGVQTSMPAAAAVLVECEGDTWADAVQESRGDLIEMVRS